MDASSQPTARCVPLLGWGVIAVLVAVGAALAMPVYYKARMEARHDEVRSALRAICVVEGQWKRHDYDKNGVADYWTRDVAGFHCIQGDSGGGVALIDLSVARADKAAATRAAELSGGSMAWEGYYFQAMLTDQDGNPYLQDGMDPPKVKNAPAGICTNMSHFGFTAFPDRYGYDGKQVFMVGEDGGVWQKDCGKSELVLDRKAAAPWGIGSHWGIL